MQRHRVALTKITRHGCCSLNTRLSGGPAAIGTIPRSTQLANWTGKRSAVGGAVGVERQESRGAGLERDSMEQEVGSVLAMRVPPQFGDLIMVVVERMCSGGSLVVKNVAAAGRGRRLRSPDINGDTGIEAI